jgi:hypothetical protein
MTKKKIRPVRRKSTESIEDLAKIAFGNMTDFCRFDANGRVHVFDLAKASEVGAKVKVTVRKVGRGKNASEVRTTQIVMPKKLPALIKLLKMFCPPEKRT